MIKTFAATMAAAFIAGAAHSAVLDFNSINNGVYYQTAYYEDGYVLRASSNSSGVHFGDAQGDNDRFGWHTGGDNPSILSWTLRRVDGSAFDVNGFRLGGLHSGDDMTVRNSNGGAWSLGSGHYNTTSSTWSNVSAVRFTLGRGEEGWIDNIRVNAVPGPAALPLAATGLALFGFLGWRRKKAEA